MKDFKIPSTYQTTNKCIRFPNDLIEDIENIIKGKNCSFSAFIIEAARYAIDNIKENDEKSTDK